MRFANAMMHLLGIQESLMSRLNRIHIGLGIAVVVALLAASWKLSADDQPVSNVKPAPTKKKKAKDKKPLLSKFMRAKLTASSQVLEGLCTEEFSLVEKGAKSLRTMSKAEKWRASNDAMYRQYSLEFRSGVERLEKAAKNKKLDAAALAWTKTTLNCIECHRWVKANLIARD